MIVERVEHVYPREYAMMPDQFARLLPYLLCAVVWRYDAGLRMIRFRVF